MLNKNENFMFSPGDGGVSWFILFFGGGVLVLNLNYWLKF